MKYTILTLFPEMFTGPFDASIIKRAKEQQIIDIAIVNTRDFATDKHKSVDDRPYGGGKGMIMRVDIIDRALTHIKTNDTKTITVLLDPKGRYYTQELARKLTSYDHIILLCGHYEGVDERVRSLVDESLSIGQYVLTGGEIPAMVIVDSVTRLLPGVLDSEATHDESFTDNFLEYPQYTRPPEYKGMKVPDILLSGNHKQIDAWRTTNKAPVIPEKKD